MMPDCAGLAISWESAKYQRGVDQAALDNATRDWNLQTAIVIADGLGINGADTGAPSPLTVANVAARLMFLNAQTPKNMDAIHAYQKWQTDMGVLATDLVAKMQAQAAVDADNAAMTNFESQYNNAGCSPALE